MRRLFAILGLSVVFAANAGAQSATNSNSLESKSALRSSPRASYEQVQRQSIPTGVSLRIEGGKAWINGNLVPDKDLPPSLANLSEGTVYQATIYGATEMSFVLNGHEYSVREGKILEIPRIETERNPVLVDNSSNTSISQRSAEDYYSQLKRESPGLFYGLSREGALYEQCRSLLMEYQIANSKQREKIREELRLVLGMLFDINERNREMEIKQLEDMIEAAKEEGILRKSNKPLIIDRTLQDLLSD